MRLIFTNCYKYNPPEHDVVKMCRKLQVTVLKQAPQNFTIVCVAQEVFEMKFARLPDLAPPAPKKSAPKMQTGVSDDSSEESESEEEEEEEEDENEEEEESESERADQLSKLQQQVHVFSEISFFLLAFLSFFSGYDGFQAASCPYQERGRV